MSKSLGDTSVFDLSALSLAFISHSDLKLCKLSDAQVPRTPFHASNRLLRAVPLAQHVNRGAPPRWYPVQQSIQEYCSDSHRTTKPTLSSKRITKSLPMNHRLLAEKTLVIFTRDNGGTPRGVNSPLRGFKGSAREGGMRVPTIVWWHAKIPANTKAEAITEMIDIHPTVAGSDSFTNSHSLT